MGRGGGIAVCASAESDWAGVLVSTDLAHRIGKPDGQTGEHVGGRESGDFIIARFGLGTLVEFPQ